MIEKENINKNSFENNNFSSNDLSPIQQKITKLGFGPDNNDKTNMNMSRNRNKNYIENVNTDFLDRYKEQDREKDYKGSNTYLDKLTSDIKSNGFNEPIILGYDANTGKTSLIEGNHRLAAAKRLGIKSIPTRMMRVNDLKSKNKFNVDPLKSQMYKNRLNRFNNDINKARNFRANHTPDDLKPSEWFSGEDLNNIK